MVSEGGHHQRLSLLYAHATPPIKTLSLRTTLVAQCLRFHCLSTSIAADIAADPWLGNKIPHAAHGAAKKKKKRQRLVPLSLNQG